MKKVGLSLLLVSSLAVAAYAAATWSEPPIAAECHAAQGSTLPISAALELWRCNETHAAAEIGPGH